MRATLPSPAIFPDTSMSESMMPADTPAVSRPRITLLSGLDCAALESALAGHDLRWCAPAQLQESAAASNAIQVVWLYRAPWSSLSGCNEPSALRMQLLRWLEGNREIFGLRRQLGKGLRLVNLEGPSASTLWRELGVDPSKAATAQQDHSIFARLFEWAGPQYWELFETLEAAAWLPTGEPSFRHLLPPPSEDAFHQALARLLTDTAALSQRHDQQDEQRQQQEWDLRIRSLQQEHAERELRLQQENEVQLLHLQQAREELESCSRRLQALEHEAAQARDSQQQSMLQDVVLQQELDRAHEQLALEQARSDAAEQQLQAASRQALALQQQLALERKRGNAAELQLQALRDDNATLAQTLERERQLLADAQLDGDAHRRQLERIRHRERERSRREASRGTLTRAAGAMRTRLRRVVGQPTAVDPSHAQLTDILDSGWFDADWYLETYQDVRAANMDPAAHYLHHGWKEGRNPSRAFDTAHYLATYTDVAESGLNPLWHFVRFGQQEGRRPRA
jgi:hypothetical protein